MYNEIIKKNLTTIPIRSSISGIYQQPMKFTEEHLHKEIEIVKVLSGSMEINIFNSPVICHTGDIIIINSNVPHSSRSIQDNTQQMLFQTDISFIYAVQTKNTVNPTLYSFFNTSSKDYYHIPVVDKLNKELSRYLTSMYSEIKAQREMYEIYVKGYLNLISACFNRNHILSSNFDSITQKKLDKIMPIIDYINDNYQHSLSINDISNATHLNEYYICRLFKSVTNQTIFNYVNHVRVCNAQTLLTTTQLNISDIAYTVGFSNISRFDEAFKRITGITPLKYRHQSHNVTL